LKATHTSQLVTGLVVATVKGQLTVMATETVQPAVKDKQTGVAFLADKTLIEEVVQRKKQGKTGQKFFVAYLQKSHTPARIWRGITLTKIR
jgi:uncharacterized protein YbcV (DUF1398 family)